MGARVLYLGNTGYRILGTTRRRRSAMPCAPAAFGWSMSRWPIRRSRAGRNQV